jgi:hypothetical protein
LALALILTACGGGGGKSNNTPTNTTNTTNPDNNSTTPKINCDGGDVINGFVMPPCPDQTLNDSTLLGIDSNSNGVRDDVERWLINRYKDHHKIVTEIGFQGARAHQFMLANPDKQEEARQPINGAQACNSYFWHYAKYYNEPILLDHDIMTDKLGFKSVSLNTKERISAFLAYDRKLSGGVYTLPHAGERKAFCTFDIDTLLGK